MVGTQAAQHTREAKTHVRMQVGSAHAWQQAQSACELRTNARQRKWQTGAAMVQHALHVTCRAEMAGEMVSLDSRNGRRQRQHKGVEGARGSTRACQAPEAAQGHSSTRAWQAA